MYNPETGRVHVQHRQKRMDTFTCLASLTIGDTTEHKGIVGCQGIVACARRLSFLIFEV